MVGLLGRWYGEHVATQTLHTEIDIAAPPSAVWEVLADLEHWSDWNRVVLGLRLAGRFQEGTKGKLRLRLAPVGVQTIGVRLACVRPPHELSWEGGLPGLMTGLHGFRLEARGEGTRLVHTETFSGLLVRPLMLALRPRLQAGYRHLNRGLRDRCERS